LAVESNSDDVVLVQAAREEMCSMFIPKNDFQHQQMRPIIKRVTYRSKSQWHVHSDEEADRLVTTFVEEVDLVQPCHQPTIGWLRASSWLLGSDWLMFDDWLVEVNLIN
jgi:hypothetical protein